MFEMFVKFTTVCLFERNFPNKTSSPAMAGTTLFFLLLMFTDYTVNAAARFSSSIMYVRAYNGEKPCEPFKAKLSNTVTALCCSVSDAGSPAYIILRVTVE